MRYISRSPLLSTLAFLALSAPAAAQMSAVTLDLGTLGGTRSSGYKVNNNGGVIGFSTLPGEMSDLAFYHDGSSMQQITLGGTSSTATDLNDAGQVVGGGYTQDNLEFQAFYFHNGQARMLSLGGSFGTATAINESGKVVGYSSLVGDMEVHAFFYDPATDIMTDLGTLGGTTSLALNINEAGQIIGFSYTTGDIATQGFRYSNGQMIPLTLDPAGSSWVREMNSSGQVVGGSMTAGGEIHAYVYDGIQIVDLGTLGGSVSEAVAINDAGVVVGNSRLAGDADSVGFFFAGNGMQPLSMGGSQSLVVDINNAGLIAGEGYLPGDSNYTAFLYENGQYSAVSLGGSFAYSIALNEQGDLIGAGQLAGSTVVLGFRLDSAGLQTLNLGGTCSFAWDINERGDVTGESWTAGDSEIHAFLAPGVFDNVAPTTTASTSASPNGAGWFNANVSLNLNASDNQGGSGVREIRYSLDGGANFTTVSGGSASIPFSADGIHAVQYFAVDNANNQGAAQSFTVQLDKTAPAVTVSTNPSVLSPPNKKMRPVTVSGWVSENLSGVASSTYRVVDEYGQIQPSGSFTVNANGSYSFVVSLQADRDNKDKNGRIYTVFVQAVDAAGNARESSATVTVPK